MKKITNIGWATLSYAFVLGVTLLLTSVFTSCITDPYTSLDYPEISGVVTDLEGNPLEGVTLYVTKDGTPEGRFNNFTEITDENGAYSFVKYGSKKTKSEWYLYIDGYKVYVHAEKEGYETKNTFIHLNYSNNKHWEKEIVNIELCPLKSEE